MSLSSAIVELARPFGSDVSQEDLGCFAMKVFSRFEAALKNASRPFAEQRGESLIIKWRELARTVEAEFDQAAVHTTVRYLVDWPPLKQGLDGDRLDWRPMAHAPSPVTLEWLLEAAYVVRNNLFHGGKRVPIPHEAHRDGRLVRGSLEVIAIVLNLANEIRDLYMEPVIEFAG